MDIRTAVTGDIDQLARLYLESSEHHVLLDPDFYRVPDYTAVSSHYAEAIRRESPSWTCFVAEIDQNLAGMVETGLAPLPEPSSMLRARQIARVEMVVGLPHRRRGIGSALMRRAERWAREHGAEMVMLDMLSANSGAHTFYRANGYVDHGSLLVKRSLEM